MDAESRPESPDGERARLSRQAVVDRALKLADADGLDALTIRKLAQDLGVTPMALYWHFRSKEDLLEGVAERVWSEVEVSVDAAQPWWSQLQKGLESLIGVLRAHPSAPRLLLEHEKQNDAALRAAETALEILAGAGFDPPQASEIARSTLWTAITLVMSEPGWAPELSGEERAEEQRRNEIFLSMLPTVRYPRLVEAAAYMANCDPDYHYRMGVELFVAGVRALADQHRRDPGGP